MEPRILQFKEKLVVGISADMSIINNKTGELWRTLRSRAGEISSRNSAEFISLQLYPPGYFDHFDPNNTFTKWACVEVSTLNHIPLNMHYLTIPAGLYAVFDYEGSSGDAGIFQYIYGEWVPNSMYRLDDRPHFEVLGDAYKHNDPTSKEEIWIPIIQK
ncbi:AraC family transcriptional regulator [Maribacter sedimenticola]|uniref:AraC family transcriptional regulator n=1 Tax=Maribacter sedimenticola TaxID=228956 RepID=A0ABY1SKH3_9FLAO|nr:GyrI-like domain-containing protein [Maribacter sedimenticola]SNR70404.1 AraC family transcriptional regulator [Maribacter sedimenticola]